MHLEEPHQGHACLHHSAHSHYHPSSAHRYRHDYHYHDHNQAKHASPTRVAPPKFVIPHFRPHFRPPLYMSDNYNTRQRRSLNLRQRPVSASEVQKPHWIPAPARSQPIVDVPKVRNRCRPRPTLPMCLVCDKRWDEDGHFHDGRDAHPGSPEEDIGTLTKRFEDNAKIAKERNQERLGTKYEDQRARVLQRLWNMEQEETSMNLEKWQDILKSHPNRRDTFASPLKPGYPSLSKKDKKARKSSSTGEKTRKKDKSSKAPHASQAAEDSTKRKNKSKGECKRRSDKNLTESFHKKEVNKDSLADQIRRKSLSSPKANDDSTDISESLQDYTPSPQIKPTPRAKKRSKIQGRTKSPMQSDFFIEVIIDELKKENRELKFSLLSRDEQLNKAAEKIHEMIEENAQLAKRLEQALEKATRHASGYDAEIQAREDAYRTKIDDLGAKVDELEKRDLLRQNQGLDEATTVVNALKKQLAECEEEKESLITYIENLKISYQTAFCKNNG